MIGAPGRGKVVAAGTLGAITIAFTAWVGGFEGLKTEPYRDVAGVLTVCYGETKGVKFHKYTKAQCDQMLSDRLRKDFAPEVAKCLKVDVYQSQWEALLDFAYNLGSTRLCSSTLMTKLNAGDCWGAAAEFERFTKAKGVEYPGLVRRRNEEARLFKEGCSK